MPGTGYGESLCAHHHAGGTFELAPQPGQLGSQNYGAVLDVEQAVSKSNGPGVDGMHSMSRRIRIASRRVMRQRGPNSTRVERRSYGSARLCARVTRRQEKPQVTARMRREAGAPRTMHDPHRSGGRSVWLRFLLASRAQVEPARQYTPRRHAVEMVRRPHGAFELDSASDMGLGLRFPETAPCTGCTGRAEHRSTECVDHSDNDKSGLECRMCLSTYAIRSIPTI